MRHSKDCQVNKQEIIACNCGEYKRAYETTLVLAAKHYIARRAGNPIFRPDGYFDNAGRWWPFEVEEQPCCYSIRKPSRNWCYSYLRHCCSILHVSQLFGVDQLDLRRQIKQMSD